MQRHARRFLVERATATRDEPAGPVRNQLTDWPLPLKSIPMRRLIVLLLLLIPAVLVAERRAKNVVLFLADAGGIPAVNAASLHGYGAPRKLFLQRMPHIALSDTTSASRFVTDSAAGMTAIVTGQKTHNNMVAQSSSGERGVRDGEPLKTILEHAEERGLSTGIVTNDALSGATPAALYAKSNDRAATAVIFRQVFTARFGDGVDVMIGAGRGPITKALAEAGTSLDELGRQHNRPVLSSLVEVPPGATRAIVVLDSADYDLAEAVQ